MVKTLKKYNRQTCRMMADRLMRESERIYKRGLVDWKGEADMIKMTKNDYADKKAIAKFLRAGNIKDAEILVSNLDTCAREDVPQSVWDWFQEWVQYTFYKEI